MWAVFVASVLLQTVLGYDSMGFEPGPVGGPNYALGSINDQPTPFTTTGVPPYDVPIYGTVWTTLDEWGNTGSAPPIDQEIINDGGNQVFRISNAETKVFERF
jgi:hypothetical protein